jgi:hypothetical protein
VRGFEIPGAWIDEVHAVKPAPAQPFSLETTKPLPESLRLRDLVDNEIRSLLAKQTAWEFENPPPAGYRWSWEADPIDFRDVDENAFSITYRPHLQEIA